MERGIVEQSVKNFKPTYRPPLSHIIFGILFILGLFWNDVVQNKLLDRGYDAQLTVFSGFTLHAGTLWYLTLLALALIILLYLLHDFAEKLTFFFDIVAGTIAFLGLGVMYAMTLVLVSGGTSVPFFSTTLTAIGLYHFGGIAIEILAALYFTFTT
ncbi:MAG TPA: hypothetical protein VLJ21_00720 [Candidatus Binatia bacterium]|nr:hypothetical protein [Candidatus Binatia bacterium]